MAYVSYGSLAQCGQILCSSLYCVKVLTIATATARLTSPLATVKRGVGDTYLESQEQKYRDHIEHRLFRALSATPLCPRSCLRLRPRTYVLDRSLLLVVARVPVQGLLSYFLGYLSVLLPLSFTSIDRSYLTINLTKDNVNSTYDCYKI